MLSILFVKQIRNYIFYNQLFDPSDQTIQQILAYFGLGNEYFKTIKQLINDERHLSELASGLITENVRRRTPLNEMRDPLESVGRRPRIILDDIRDQLENVEGRPRIILNDIRDQLENVGRRPRIILDDIRDPRENVVRPILVPLPANVGLSLPPEIVWKKVFKQTDAFELLLQDHDLYFEIQENWKTDRKEDAIAFLAKQNKVNAGLIAGYQDPDQEDAMFISIVVVKERFKGSGIGRMLIEKFEDWARKRGYTKVTLVVADDNADKAVNFFERVGYSRSEYESVWQLGSIDMSKDL